MQRTQPIYNQRVDAYRKFFTPEKGYDSDENENGLPHRDMIWFELDVS